MKALERHKGLRLAALLAGLMALQGCVSGVILGAIGAVSVINDRRTAATQLEDETIETKANKVIRMDEGLDQHTHLNVISYNRTVLIVGQSPNQMLRDRVTRLVEKVDSVSQVFNQIRIGNVTTLTTRSNDSWLTSKVKVALTTEKDFSSSQIKVITENGEVFLLGLVTQAEGDKATEIARNVNGVRQVIKAFEYRNSFTE